MKFRLKRIGVLKAAIMGGIGYAILSLVFVPFFMFFMMVAPMTGEMGPMPGEWMMGGALLLLMPILYGIFGFIGTGLAAAVFNLISMMIGGLEVELERAEPESTYVTPAAPAPPPPATPGY